MKIEDLAKTKANSIPNSQLVKFYEAAVPQYHIETILTMEKRKKLSVLQEFILKFVVEGIDEINTICNFLGITLSTIHTAIASLKKEEIVSIDIFNSKLKITEKGAKALKEAATIVPEDIEYAIYMDGLLGNIYLDPRSKYNKKQVKAFDLVAIAPNIEAPTIDDLSYEDVKNAINLFKKRYSYEQDKLEGDLLEIACVEKTYVEYNKLSILVFMNNKTEDLELQVYEGSTRNTEYENTLLQMYNNDTHIFEFDKKDESDNVENLSLLSTLPAEIIEGAKEFAQKESSIDKEITQLNTQLLELQEHNNEMEEGDESLTQKIRFLEKRIQEMEKEKKGADRILSTYDHRPLLIKALTEAQNCVVIISPWIKEGGVNSEIINLIDKAASRKTRIIIGYGINEKDDSDKWIIKRLEEIKKKPYGKFLELIRLSNTHEKVLIVDNSFMVITSFNWLSFKGDPNRGFRQETGYYTESKECIADMKKNLSQEQRLGIEIYRSGIMANIVLDDGEKIPAGNFAFLDDDLGKKFYEAEKYIKINYIDFSHKLRIAVESFALEEECKKRKALAKYTNFSSDDIKSTIIEEIKQPASIMNYKNIIIDLCSTREKEFTKMLQKYSFIYNSDDLEEVRRKLKTYIRFVYTFGSESSHANTRFDNKYLPNRENCFRVISSFHDFLCIYYNIEKKFDSTLIPVRDYIPVPREICEKMGLSLDTGKYLYVKEKEGKYAYYIFSSDIDNISLSQRRDIETLNKLWENNFEDPANIIRKTEDISGCEGDYKFQVYSLPNKPLRLTIEMIEKLSVEDKLDIIRGICRGILTLHNYKPSFYHRNICPEAFYLFNVNGKYKALLARFDCTKDTSAHAEYTVFNNVEKKVYNKKTNQFFAPEVIKADMGKGVDWEKADIYALAKTCLFILTGRVVENTDDLFRALEICGISDDIKYVLIEMMSKKPEERLGIQDLLNNIN
jgi:hypothetical protein